MAIRIGNGAGFWGDDLSAPSRMVERAELDYLTLEYLAELSMSILARQREKNPQLGYAGDFLDVLASLIPSLSQQPGLKLITNAGGINPRGCVTQAARMLRDAGLGDCRIAAVDGDNLLDSWADVQKSGCAFQHLDTGAPLAEKLAATPAAKVVSANAYLGAKPIVEALAKGARIVVTGRVADASLTVAPAVHEFGWQWNDWNRLAGASVAGHVIECGAQATGGYFSGWRDVDFRDLGFPIAELSDDGSCVITKAPGGGVVNRRTVVSQLVYEIGDPAHYLTPDVDVDFTTLELSEIGPDRVRLSGASGRPAPASYKVSLAYHDGYATSSQLLVFGADCREKAQRCVEMIFARLRSENCDPAERLVEFLGTGEGVPSERASAVAPPELMLRISVRDPRREVVERFTRQFAPLITGGPPGLAGYATARSDIRPVYAYWPTLIPQSLVLPNVEVRSAHEWQQ
ncbi:MAG: acyclic terpene utilization AtuA family protein [Planctomycetia bacterium]|nr:acyclic terpene utilization AtuA family protein [Planctomycetia bacterium]